MTDNEWIRAWLDRGIDDQLEMYFQPVVWLESGENYGAESLIR